MSIICPICQKDDAIRKVSTVSSAGHSTGTFSGPTVGVDSYGGDWPLAGGYTTLSGSVSTLLAQKLSPPAEPKGLSCIIWGLAIYPGFPIIVAIPGAIVLVPLTSLVPQFPNLETVFSIVAIIWLIISIPLTTFFYFRYIKRHHDAKLAREKHRYQIQKDFWDNLYYCFRDDVVFNPQSGEHFPSSSFHEILEDHYNMSLARNN
jgi:hypothetical protein